MEFEWEWIRQLQLSVFMDMKLKDPDNEYQGDKMILKYKKNGVQTKYAWLNRFIGWTIF